MGVVPVRSAFCLFRALGDLHYRAGGEKKRVILESLSTQLGLNGSRGALVVKRNFENHYTDRLHIFLYNRIKTEEEIDGLVRFESLEILRRELEGDRGALIVQPHFGPVLITLLALALKGFRPMQVGYPSEEGLSFIGRHVAYRYRLRYEAILPAPIISADGFLGPVYRHLKGGGVVLTTGDGAGGGVYLGEHRKLDFLSSKRLFPLGPASLALRTGSAYIPTFIIPEGAARFRIVFEEPVRPVHGDYEKDRVYMTEAFRTVAEKYIRRYPHCWHFWDDMINK